MKVSNQKFVTFLQYHFFSWCFTLLSAFFAASTVHLFAGEAESLYRFAVAGMLDDWLASYTSNPFTTVFMLVVSLVLYWTLKATSKLALDCNKRSRKIKLL